MMNFMNIIPENLGWAIVGGLAVVCAYAWWKLAKVFVEMYKEWREDLEAELAE